MRVTPVRLGRLIAVSAGMEMLFGLAIHALPHQFTNPAYDPVRSQFPLLAMAFMGGSVLLLLLYRYPVRPAIRGLMALPGAASMLLFSWLFARVAVWSGAIHYGLVGSALLVAPWLSASEDEGWDVGAVVLGVIQALLGTQMLFSPASFGTANYQPIQGWVPLAGVVGITGAVALIWPQFQPNHRKPPWYLAIYGALFSLTMFADMLLMGIWTGLGWGLWAISLLVGDRPIRVRHPESADEQEQRLQEQERILELWTWTLMLVMLGLSAFASTGLLLSPTLSLAIIVALAGYNMLMYVVIPGVGSISQRIVCHLAYLTLVVGFSLMDAGALGPVLLPFLVVVGPIATRAAGPLVGRALMGLAMLLVIGVEVHLWLTHTKSLDLAVATAAIESLVLLSAAGMGINSVASELRFLQELRGSRSTLQRKLQDLQAAHEELMAQEEELQNLHDALCLSEAQLSGIVTAAPYAILAMDGERRIQFFNRRATEIFGYDEQEVLGQPVEMLMPPQVAARHPQQVADFLQGEAVVGTLVNGAEMHGRRKSGEEFPAEIAVAKGAHADGSLVTVIVQDISDRRMTERILEESEERFRSAFQNAPIGMAILDPAGHWLRVNPALCEMLGYGEEEMVGRGIKEMVEEEDGEAECSRMAQLSSGAARSFRGEIRYRHKDGHLIWAHQSCSMVPNQRLQSHSFIIQVEDITERKRYEERLIHLADHDPLTDLFNRRRFQEELEGHLAFARFFGVCGAVLLLDLDHFKYVNDIQGHGAGDELLRRLAVLLKERARDSDTVARLGGDEFALLLPYTQREEALALTRELMQALGQEISLSNGARLSISASVGIVLYPEHGTVASDLLAYADVAMYAAKEQGRNCSAVFTPEGDWKAEMRSKLLWDHRIRSALREERFVLLYQPILNMRSDRVSQYELLLRMVGDGDELIPPGAFLGLAERSGLILEIDRWVVRRSIQMMAEQKQAGRELIFEVNLSGKTLSDPDLFTILRDELSATGVNPANLVLEITETAAIGDIEQAQRFIAGMKALGCRFALDDVGTGFSSFYYLKELAVDYVKIDGSFVRNLINDAADQHVVKALVAVAKELGRETIAEFVDSEETLELLRSYGVDYAQGFWVGRPVPTPRR